MDLMAGCATYTLRVNETAYQSKEVLSQFWF